MEYLKLLSVPLFPEYPQITGLLQFQFSDQEDGFELCLQYNVNLSLLLSGLTLELGEVNE